MQSFLHSITSMQSPWNMVVLVVMIASAAGVIGTVAKQIRKYACHRGDMQLKRELVERGLSVEEIERIIAASSPIQNLAEK